MHLGVGGGVNTLKFHNGAAIVTNDPGGTQFNTHQVVEVFLVVLHLFIFCRQPLKGVMGDTS